MIVAVCIIRLTVFLYITGGGKNSTGPGKGSSAQTSSVSAETGLAAVLPSLTHTADVLDMPVDPNEPTYCLCHQVSYGEMIGCDNPDVCTLISTNVFLHLLSINQNLHTSS